MKTNEMHCFSNVFDKLLYMFRTASVVILISLADVNRTSMTNTYCVRTALRYS